MAAPCCCYAFHQQGLQHQSRLKERWIAQYTGHYIQFARDLRLGQRITFQQGNHPEHAAKATAVITHFTPIP